MPMFKKATFKVACVLPDGVTAADFRDYLKEAANCWSKSFNPNEDPRFNIGSGIHEAKVTRIVER